MPKSVSIIGSGTVGTAVGHLLKSKGYDIKGVAARQLDHAESAVSFIGAGSAGTDTVEAASGADWVLITTPDKSIREACETIAAGGGFKKGALVVHFSGALSSEELKSAARLGARVISLHPIQSLASVEQAVKNLPGSYFSMEGDPAAADEGREIVEALGGKLVVIPTDKKSLYHAGAAIASNYLVSVVDLAVSVFENLGMERDDALRAIFPLIQGTVNNIEKVGVPDALTGPIARGDVGTVQGHIEALLYTMPDRLELYKQLGAYTVKVGREKGSLREEDAERLLQILKKD